MSEDYVSIAQEVVYCPHCDYPLGYCQWSECYNDCKVWLEENYPEQDGESTSNKTTDNKTEEGKEKTVDGSEDDEEEDDEEEPVKKQAKKPKVKFAEKKASKMPPAIIIGKTQRSKRKFVTTIKGVESIGLKAKDVAKVLSKKFACSASVSQGEIILQGDIEYDLADLMVEQYDVDKKIIYRLDKNIRKRFFR